MERVDRLRLASVEEILWALEGNWRAEMDVGKASEQGLWPCGRMTQVIVNDFP